MSRLSRFRLLSTLIHSELAPQHLLGGRFASKDNQILIDKAIFHFVFLCEDILCGNGLSVQSRDTRLKNLIRYINDHDFSCVISSLKDTYDILIDHISGKRYLADFFAFKERQQELGLSTDGILYSTIKEDLLHVISSQTVVSRGVYRNDSTRAMKNCSLYLLFLSKLNFESVGLEDKALADYLIYEDENRRLDLTSHQDIILPLQAIITDWFKDWSYDGLGYQHGPGSVADARKGKYFKYHSLSSDSKLQYLFKNTEVTLDQTLPVARPKFQRQSKLIFVPKNVKKLRSISMEPATLQYYQQGMLRSLMDYFKKHKTLRNILHLSDQHWNKSFAYHGSITNEYATIDLSHASDSVTWGLVKQLFSKLPKVYKWLLCTRSSHTLLPNGETIELSKFAPMGSALCFPIESIIFAAIAVLANRLSIEEAVDRDNDTGIRRKNTTIKVYGDDIIIPSYASNKCISFLKRLGFTPNEDKSFLSGPFKESCGGNFFCGYDITAIKFNPSYSAKYESRGFIGPEAYTTLCSYANHAYESGLPLFRLSCIHQLLDNGIKPLFTDEVGVNPAIFSPCPTNFHLKRKYVGYDRKTKTNYMKNVLVYTGTKTVYEECHRPDIDDISYFDRELNTRSRSDNILSSGFDVSQGTFDSLNEYNADQLFPGKLTYCWCQCDTIR